MPIYEFKCNDCNERFEEVQTFSKATREAPCPSCGASAPKVISMPGINTTVKEFYPYVDTQPRWMNYSEKKSFLRSKGLREAGDSLGGSKDEVYKSMASQAKAAEEKARKEHRREFLKKEVAKWDLSKGLTKAKRKYD